MSFAHQSRDAMLAARLSGFAQVEEDARGAVDAVTCDERCPNQAKEPGVLLRAVRDRLLQPLVVAALRHAEYTTHHLHAVLLSMRLDEFVHRTDSPGAWLHGHRNRPPLLCGC